MRIVLLEAHAAVLTLALSCQHEPFCNQHVLRIAPDPFRTPTLLPGLRPFNSLISLHGKRRASDAQQNVPLVLILL